jgi:hypothetical protein
VIAPTCPVTGFTQSAMSSAITGCASGSWVTFPAGTYSLTSHIVIPCGVNVTGPFVSTTPWPGTFTANLNGSLGADWGFYMPGAGCTTPMTVQYFNWNGGDPTNGGGGFIYVPNTGQSNITIRNNHIYGNQAGQPSAGSVISGTLIYFDGYSTSAGSSPIVSNVTIQNNYFGSTAHVDCSNVMQLTDYYGGHYDGVGGQCAALGMHTGSTNFTFQFNKIEFQEQGMKFYEAASGYAGQQYPCLPQAYCNNNSNINYNDFSYIHRCGIENQSNPSTTMNFDYNVFRDIYYGQYGAWFVSDPAYYAPSGGPYTSPVTSNVSYNLFIGDAPCVGSGCYTPGIEFWSTGSGNYNLCQVGSGIASLGFAWGNGTTPWSISYNTLQNCATRSEGEPGYSAPPTQTGNSSASSISALTSAQPTISPASQSFPVTQLVTLTNSGANRDLNTPIWYTTDGTTPVPGSGTAQLYTGPFYVNRTTTVNAVGMWGAANQPTSYPTNYGYVPSAVTTATYTLSGSTPTLTSVTVTATDGTTNMQVGNTVQMIATCNYSDGEMLGCNTEDAYGHVVTGWMSSAPAVTINSSGVASGASIGSANIQATVTGGVQSSLYGLTVSAAPNTLQSVTLATAGGVSSIAGRATNQLSATCQYSNGTQTSCGTAADSYGNEINSWASSAPTIATVNGSGLVTGVAAGSTNISGSVTPQPAQLGGNVYSFSNTTHNGYLNYTYAVTGSAASGYSPQSCYIYLPSQSIASGTEWDCVLIAAPSTTTQAANALCSNRYTFSSATSWTAGFLTIPMNSCAALSPDTAYWVASVQNQATASRGVWSCSSSTTTGSCGSSIPTLGSGTYGYCYYAGTFGSYTGMSPALTCGQTSQITQYVTVTATPVTSPNLTLTVTAAPPTLTSAYLSAASSGVTVGSTLQFAARCVYTNPSTTTDCTVADIYGNAVSAWATSNANAATIGTVGSSNAGLLTGVSAGTTNVTAVINGVLTSSSYPVTVTAPLVALTGVSLATTGGVTGLFVGNTNHLIATCTYSDGSTTNCTSTDSHGNVAGSYVSTNAAAATVSGVTGLVTAVAPGTTTFTATTGGATSPALPLTVLPIPSGVYSIVITGPVSFIGTVRF